MRAPAATPRVTEITARMITENLLQWVDNTFTAVISVPLNYTASIEHSHATATMNDGDQDELLNNSWL